ncbi:hypothetical protein EWB00_007645 [Schistosoma japonicum]|uniref:Uncharacterized protein n=1 Tax=Schistosoma japonicum TaxID=6182 RepID=A0A4Z2CTP8_SCHJA|nr:hypothetical protein EWB00_007645 [Schistosoma japonicum]
MLCILLYRALFIISNILSFNYHITNGFILPLPLNIWNSSTPRLTNQSLYIQNFTSNGDSYSNDSILETNFYNQTDDVEEELFVESSAGVWVISVMSGTCILTIAFIVRGLFSRAEAYHDGPENHHGTDINGNLMGVNGFTGASGGAEMGFLSTNMA